MMYYPTENIQQPLMFQTLGGQFVTVRQAMLADAALLADLLCRLSARTRHLRYMSPRYFSADVIWNEAVRMARGHSPDHMTLVATIPLNEDEQAVAVAELVRDRQTPTLGEIALIVRDDEQRQGIGIGLLRHLVDVAHRGGITALSANMLAENDAMLGLIRRLGQSYTAITRYGETQVLVSTLGYHGRFALTGGAGKLAA